MSSTAPQFVWFVWFVVHEASGIRVPLQQADWSTESLAQAEVPAEGGLFFDHEPQERSRVGLSHFRALAACHWP